MVSTQVEVVGYKLIEDKLRMIGTGTIQGLMLEVQRHPSAGKLLTRYCHLQHDSAFFWLTHNISLVANFCWRLLEPMADADGRESQNQGASGTFSKLSNCSSLM